jgi:polyisoprenyl-phosphate glycosyltransferase
MSDHSPEITLQPLKPKLFFVLPVYNDWNSLERLVSEISSLDFTCQLHFVIVDDCSSEFDKEIQNRIRMRCEISGGHVEVLRLARNRGNQFAIWVGLNHLYQSVDEKDLILVMDSDGEDDPRGIPELLSARRTGIPTVAKRGNRNNSLTFKLWHYAYKRIFKYFTGENLDFGNFSVIDRLVLERILADESSNYVGYVGGLLSSSAEIIRVPLNRGTRYHGKSKTSVQRLIQWGLLQVSPFTDAVFSQALKLSVKFTGSCLAASTVFLVLRVLEISVIPGWTSLFVSLALAISFLLMIFTAMFLALFFILNTIRVELKLNEPADPQYSIKVKKFLVESPDNAHS